MADDATMRLDAPLRSVRVVGAEAQGAAGRTSQVAAESADAMRLRMQVELEREKNELVQAKAALLSAGARLAELQAQVVKESEGPLLDLAVGIARKVLMQEIQADRHEIEPIVRKALSLVDDGRDVTVHLHPDDLARCEQAAGGVEDTGRSGVVRFVADPSVSRAECVVEGPAGFVASRIESHLDDISEALRSAEAE